jgi:hypothetical protein
MTPGGKLQSGDKIQHVSSGMVATVIKREGNDDIYSVILKPDEGLPWNVHSAFGYPGCFRLLEAPYWLKQGTYRLVEEKP